MLLTFPIANKLVKRIPNSLGNPLCEAKERSPSDAVETETLSSQRNIQGNALQNWDKHVRHRRQQQDVLSGELIRDYNSLHRKEINCASLLEPLPTNLSLEANANFLSLH